MMGGPQPWHVLQRGEEVVPNRALLFLSPPQYMTVLVTQPGSHTLPHSLYCSGVCIISGCKNYR